MDILKQILTQFGVEWPKFFAQLFLFIIVYLVLKKFAFGPIIAMLEERRRRIEEGQANAEKIKKQLAESEARYQEILTKANGEAQKMLDEAKTGASVLAERRSQQAIEEAGQIIAKAREATTLDHDRVMAELKREVGRLVIETTTKVTGKILTDDDHKRLSEEVAGQVSA